MSWGGAPPWVYKNEIAHAQNNAFQANSEASKYKEMIAKLSKEKTLLLEQKMDILKEITHYQTLKKDGKLDKKTMEKIIEKIKDVISNEKQNS